MYVKTNYDGCSYITKDKVYEVFPDKTSPKGFSIIDDTGGWVFCIYEGDASLDDGDWIICDEHGNEVE